MASLIKSAMSKPLAGPVNVLPTSDTDLPELVPNSKPAIRPMPLVVMNVLGVYVPTPLQPKKPPSKRRP